MIQTVRHRDGCPSITIDGTIDPNGPKHSLMLTKDFNAYECYDTEVVFRKAGANVIRIKSVKELNEKFEHSKKAYEAETKAVIEERQKIKEKIDNSNDWLRLENERLEKEKKRAILKRKIAKVRAEKRKAMAKKTFHSGDLSIFEEII